MTLSITIFSGPGPGEDHGHLHEDRGQDAGQKLTGRAEFCLRCDGQSAYPDLMPFLPTAQRHCRMRSHPRSPEERGNLTDPTRAGTQDS